MSNFKFSCFVLFFLALSIEPLAQQEGEPETLYGHRAQQEVPEAELRPVGNYRDTGRVVRLEAGAAAAFEKLRAAAAGDGVEIVPISGFRTREYQAGLFRRAVKRHGSAAAAARWVAPPGYSEHHTGQAIDLGDESRPDCDVQLCFAQTPAYAWLRRNAARYRFVLSFPPGSQQPAYEPWHWRFASNSKSQ